MKIININITEFGSIKEKSFDLCEGMNIFEGNNESGKSTLVAFIKFILYGFPRRKASEAVQESERGLSWQSNIAAGSLTVSTENGDFRIERKSTGKGKDSVQIIDLATGMPTMKDVIPGEAFLGMPVALYESTSCINQLACTSINGAEVGNAVENIIKSADEGINTAKVLSNLDNFRISLLHKNGSGGKIFELKKQLNTLLSRLSSAKKNSEDIIVLTEATEKYRELCAEVRVALNLVEDKCSAYEQINIIKRFDTLHEYEEKINKVRNQIEMLIKERSIENSLPNRKTADIIREKERLLTISENEFNFRKSEFENASALPAGNREYAAMAETIRENGDKAVVCDRFTKLKNKIKAAKGSAFTAVVCASVCIAGTIISAVLNNYVIGASLFAVGLALIITAILLNLKKQNLLYSLESMLEKLGLSEKIYTVDEFSDFIECCFENERAVLANENKLSALRAKLYEAEKEFLYHKNACIAEISKFGFGDARDETAVLHSHIANALEICNDTAERYDALDNELKQLTAVKKSIENELSDYNESYIRARIPAEMLKELSKINNDDLREQRQKLREKLNEYDTNRQKLEKQLTAIEAQNENPQTIALEIDRYNAEISDAEEKYSAIKLAMDSILTASENIKKESSPVLRAEAGRYLEKITNGKYSQIGISADITKLAIESENATHHIDSFSKGTRDAVYIALRLALIKFISKENTVPLIFDEALSQLDNTRAENMLRMLSTYCEDGQCLLFTCHTREAEFFKDISREKRYCHFSL